MTEIVRAFLLIFIAEMGDKTQILAMAFATRYPVRKVLLGIGIGAFLNHGLAVMLGSLLGNVIPISTIQMIAGAAFIGFALWTLKSEEDDEEEEAHSMRFGPIPTVALAFFLGELGDKTQLTAITLAADAVYPYLILVGTVAGMIATGGLGIFVGKKMGDNIPEITIKLFAAAVFMFFGLQKLIQTVPSRFLVPTYILPFTVVLTAIVFLMVRQLFKARKEGIQSEFIQNAKRIHDYNTHIEVGLKNLDDTNLTESQTIGRIADTLYMMNDVANAGDLTDAITLLRELEYRLLGRYLKSDHHLQTYFDELADLSPRLSQKIAKAYRLRHPIEERILNLGDGRNNLYMVEIDEGYMLIDTGHDGGYPKFLETLTKKGLELNDITYIFITHAHHVGFLGELLKRTDAKVILHPLAADRIKSGIETTDHHYTSLISKIYYLWMSLIGRGPGNIKPVNRPERYQLVDDRFNTTFGLKINGKVIHLPGHSADSIGLVMYESAFFCGDALMNRAVNRNPMAMRLEDQEAYRATWHKMLELNYKTIYPTHGKPFTKAQLLKHKDKLIWNQY